MFGGRPAARPFHGDLHAGNLYVDEAGRIVFFDLLGSRVASIHAPAGYSASWCMRWLVKKDLTQPPV